MLLSSLTCRLQREDSFFPKRPLTQVRNAQEARPSGHLSKPFLFSPRPLPSALACRPPSCFRPEPRPEGLPLRLPASGSSTRVFRACRGLPAMVPAPAQVPGAARLGALPGGVQSPPQFLSFFLNGHAWGLHPLPHPEAEAPLSPPTRPPFRVPSCSSHLSPFPLGRDGAGNALRTARPGLRKGDRPPRRDCSLNPVSFRAG